MNDLLSEPVVSRLVGVTDLRDGRAVHAIAGQRDNYRDVACCRGDAVELAEQYRTLGVACFYIADLDAIAGGPIQAELIDRLCCQYDGATGIVDIGWTGTAASGQQATIANLSRKHSSVQWVAATESIRSLDSLTALSSLTGAERVLLGLDFRGGQLISTDSSNDETTWISGAQEIGCAGTVILDIASVGTSSGPTSLEICRRVRQGAPSWQIYSGGGVREARDVKEFLGAGCNRCLVGTALHQLCVNSS